MPKTPLSPLYKGDKLKSPALSGDLFVKVA